MAAIKHFSVATALGLLGGACWLQTNHAAGSTSTALLYTLAGTLWFAAAAVLLSVASPHRSRAWLRLDWYLPMLRTRKPQDPLDAGWLGRMARRRLPSRLFSDRTTKRRGWARVALRRLGPSWLASPWRRLLQSICLGVFLVAFFYVCWPYTAAPAPPARSSAGWTLVQVDQESGALVFARTGTLEWPIEIGAKVFPSPSDEDAERKLLPFLVSEITEQSLRLRPESEPSSELLDLILTEAGQWTLWDKDPNAWPSHYADDLDRKELIDAEFFLIIDPLVSLSTAIASRSWVWSLASAGCILLACVLIPRGFCGYLCPLGTTIDLFDWAIAGRVTRFRAPDDGWWVHIKYYLLTAILVAALCGVLISGFFSAIPVITRGLLFLCEPLQSGAIRGWRLVPSMHAGQAISLLLFFAVLSLGFLRPRFWCKYVCPSGAVFSLGNLFRVSERKVESSCIHCNKCVEVCPFDAIKPDFTTRTTDCTLCQTCAGVCPTHAIKFVERVNLVQLKTENDPPTGETSLGRRGFLSAAAGGAAALTGGLGAAVATDVWGADLNNPDAHRPVRPPGSVPEQEFLQMCIRCGECFKACPNNVLQAEGFEQGLEGLWAPQVVADWAGCDSSCNACGQVCPTGAIRALPLEEKKVARMGLAIVNEFTCLPFAEREACDLCVQECDAAGYHAIEYTQVGTQVDSDGLPIEGTGYLAPVVLADKCVGCGLCQTRCYGVNVKSKSLLKESAIVIEAGPGREDRLMNGSYIALREAEREEREKARDAKPLDFFVPDKPAAEDDNPFGGS